MKYSRAGSSSPSTSMKFFSIVVCLLVATMLRQTGAEIYMIRMADPPVLSYTGSVPGLKATAASEGRRADVSRYIPTISPNVERRRHDPFSRSSFAGSKFGCNVILLDEIGFSEYKMLRV